MTRGTTRRVRVAFAALAAATTITSSTLSAQTPSSPTPSPSPAGAFITEAAGATLGSAVGFGTVLLLSSSGDGCGDNLSCILGNVAAAVTLGTVGAASGAYIAGTTRETRPSLAGAALGAVAGAAAGIGVHHLVTEEASVNLSDPARIVVYSVTQGVVTALGSRVFAALRDR